jgi:hypothetical protein
MTNTDDTTPARPHTPEPWSQDSNDLFAVTADKDGFIVAVTEVHDRTDEECDANARRIAAAINACRGIATEALEQDVVAELLQALEWQEMAGHDPEASRRKGYFDRAREHRRAAIAKAKGGRP